MRKSTSNAQFPERVGIRRPDYAEHKQQTNTYNASSLNKSALAVSGDKNLKAAHQSTHTASSTLPTSGELYKGVLRRRLVAFMLDLLFIGITVSVIKAVLVICGMSLTSWGLQVYASVGIIVTLAYNTILIASKWQATLGMASMGLKVTTPQGGRPQFKHDLLHVGLFYLLYFMVFPVVIDFMSAIFRKDRRTFRDRLTGYVIVRAAVFDKIT